MVSSKGEMGAAMCNLSDKVGQHVRKKSTGTMVGGVVFVRVVLKCVRATNI